VCLWFFCCVEIRKKSQNPRLFGVKRRGGHGKIIKIRTMVPRIVGTIVPINY